MRRQPSLIAQCSHLWHGFAVYVNLPVKRGQWREVVPALIVPVHLHPGQNDHRREPVPHAPRSNCFHGSRLRYSAKHKAPHRLKREDQRSQKPHDSQSHEPCHRSRARHTREGPVGRCDQPPGESDALRLIAIKQRRLRARATQRQVSTREITRKSVRSNAACSSPFRACPLASTSAT
jgi:hypothetical protein